MTRPRDTQRSKFLRLLTDSLPMAIQNGTVPLVSAKEACAYLEKLTSYAVIRRHYPESNQSVRLEWKGERCALQFIPGVEVNTLVIGAPELSQFALLRLFAYHLARQRHGDSIAWHGREYVKCLLELVRWCMSKGHADELRKALIDAGVSYKAKRRISAGTRLSLKQRGFQGKISRVLAKYADA